MYNTLMSFFTIVIPTLNEEKYLPQLLQDLAKQSYDGFTVIVVDGGSTDETVQLAQQFAPQLTLQIIRARKKGVSHQRNLGGRAAQSPWILFMDADNRLPTYFLDGLRYHIARHPHTDVFTTLVDTTADAVDSAIQHTINLSLELAYRVNKPQAFGAMIGCKTTLFKRLQFDEQTKYLEDSTFIDAVTNQGYAYQLFRQPRYGYSLRRIKKEGGLNMLRTGALMQIEFLQGKRKFTDNRYPMLGGGYYAEQATNSITNNLQTLQKFLKDASDKQLKQARKLLRAVKMDLD